MNLFKGQSESSPKVTVGPRTDRRTFLRTLLASLGVAVPAFRVLASTPAASAAPDNDPCSRTYLVLLDQWCTNGEEGCPNATGYNCMQQWQERSVETGQSCGTFIRQEGVCGYYEM